MEHSGGILSAPTLGAPAMVFPYRGRGLFTRCDTLIFKLRVAFSGSSVELDLPAQQDQGSAIVRVEADLSFLWQPQLDRFLLSFGHDGEMHGSKGDEVAVADRKSVV